MKFVLDCSVTMAWCFENESTPYTERVLSSLSNGYQAIVPVLWKLEVVNVLLLGMRKLKLSSLIAHNFKNNLTQLPIYTDTEDRTFNAVFDVAKEFNLTAYDAAYFEIALREKIPLATLDTALIQAAKKQKISIFSGN